MSDTSPTPAHEVFDLDTALREHRVDVRSRVERAVEDHAGLLSDVLVVVTSRRDLVLSTTDFCRWAARASKVDARALEERLRGSLGNTGGRVVVAVVKPGGSIAFDSVPITRLAMVVP